MRNWQKQKKANILFFRYYTAGNLWLNEVYNATKADILLLQGQIICKFNSCKAFNIAFNKIKVLWKFFQKMMILFKNNALVLFNLVQLGNFIWCSRVNYRHQNQIKTEYCQDRRYHLKWHSSQKLWQTKYTNECNAESHNFFNFKILFLGKYWSNWLADSFIICLIILCPNNRWYLFWCSTELSYSAPKKCFKGEVKSLI